MKIRKEHDLSVLRSTLAASFRLSLSTLRPRLCREYIVHPVVHRSIELHTSNDFSIKAFCLKKIARQKPESEAVKLIDDSARFYWQAAQKFPEDDEYCCCTWCSSKALPLRIWSFSWLDYITVSLSTWWNFNGVPISTVLPRLEKLKECYPKMLRIWKNSGSGIPSRDIMIRNCLDYYETLQKKLRSGELNKKSVYNPDFKFHE